jgi:catalase
MFFIRDGIKFPDFVQSQKLDPHTHRQEPDDVWDFFSYTPEATHQFVWLFGDRGIPASLRQIDGFGSHTFQWANAQGERFWVKFHFKTDQGIKCLTSEQAAMWGGREPAYLHKELYDAIERGERPSWTLKVQVMPEAEAATYHFDPFDLTTIWPYKGYPLIPIGKLVLDSVPDNYFAETEQSAFDPANFVPGIGPSPDRMVWARLFACGDAQRYRLGINHTRLEVNSPKAVAGGARNHGRDGSMRLDDNGGRSKNYEPNSYGSPAPAERRYEHGVSLSGTTGPHPQPHHVDNDDFVQAGALYRVMKEDERQRLIDNLSGSLAQVARQEVIERSISYFAKADGELGRRLTEAVAQRRGAGR